MNVPVVVTSINKPTDAVRALGAISSAYVILVGDRKSPSDYDVAGVRFLPLDDQMRQPYRLASALPVDHYCRKNIGYLTAMEDATATLIAESDDDNFPLEPFLKDPVETVRGTLVVGNPWVNIYPLYTDRLIWPRGVPLETVRSAPIVTNEAFEDSCPIQQYLADGDPDVDAIYRMIDGSVDHSFPVRDVILSIGSYTTFNSQATVWFPAAWPLMYLPSNVTFRMTDIWRSLVAQRCLHALGRRLAYRGAGVRQERNEHDLAADFADEVPGYLNNARIVTLLESLTLPPGRDEVGANLVRCYEALIEAGYVPKAERPLVEMWLDDVHSALSKRAPTE